MGMLRSTASRVVVTGLGVVSPFGVGRHRFWDSVRSGCSATRLVEEFDTSALACRVAAPVTGVSIDDLPAIDGDDLRDLDYRADPKRYSRAALIAVIAAREAWLDAGLRIGEPGAAVVIGSGGGGIDVGERQYYDFFVERGRKVTPYAIPVSIVGMMSSEISISLRLRGLSHVLSCGCTSSTDALGYAAAVLRSGEADVVLSGGADACVTPGMMYRVLAHARHGECVQRRTGTGLATLRSAARRLRAGRRRVDAGAGTRGSRARQGRAHLRVHRRLRVDV